MSKFSYSKEKFIGTTIIGRKVIISNSNKMQPLQNALRAWQTIPAGYLKKWEPSKKHTKTN